MTTTEAQSKIGLVVASDCEIWGALEYVTADGWAGIRALPPVGSTKQGRLDEIQVARIFPA